MRSIEIATAELEDAEPLSNLLREIISQLPYYNARAKTEELAKYTAPLLRELITMDREAILLARGAGQIVGFCLSRYDDGLVWLSWIGVRPGYRKIGVAGELLLALSETLGRRGAHKLWCDTRTENVGSQRLLAKFGFRRVAELTNHWYGQDFFLWEWMPA